MSFTLHHFTNTATDRSPGVFPEKPAPVNIVISTFEVMKDMGRRAYEIHISHICMCAHTLIQTQERGEWVKGFSHKVLLLLLHRSLRKSVRDLGHSKSVSDLGHTSTVAMEKDTCHATTIEPPPRGFVRSISIPSQVQAPSSTAAFSVESEGDPPTHMQEAQEGRSRLKLHRCPPTTLVPKAAVGPPYSLLLLFITL